MNKNKEIENFTNEFSVIIENKNELYITLIPLILSKNFKK